jgi:hypothetical protein
LSSSHREGKSGATVLIFLLNFLKEKKIGLSPSGFSFRLLNGKFKVFYSKFLCYNWIVGWMRFVLNEETKNI